MAVLKGHADKRTEEQRRNDAAPTTGKADERDDNPAPPVQEEIPVTVVPSKPAGGITDDAGNGPGVKR